MTRQIILVATIMAGALPLTGKEPWQDLFNGRDLDGWRGDERIWSVTEGVIQGSTHDFPLTDHNSFLIYDGVAADFELVLEFRIVGGNSGIQYRSRVVDPNAFIVAGYQADIDDARTYTGILYEEKGRGILTLRGERSLIGRDGQHEKLRYAASDKLRETIGTRQWNSYRIKAQGSLLRHWINGRLMSETEDHSVEDATASGKIALQVHSGPAMLVQFRNLRLRNLQSQQPRPADSPNYVDSATPAESLRLPDGFRAELIYSVPADDDVSWVSLTVDPQGRLVTSDQYGHLYRTTPALIGNNPRVSFVERLEVKIGKAHGMTFVGNRLYVVVNNEDEKGPHSGLYRVSDADGDEELDKVELLRELDGSGEHGPHVAIADPKGTGLYVLAGNHTSLTDIDGSRVPQHWAEDQLLPRLWDAQGHAAGILAPGGWICRTDLDGKDWELFSIGFRNPYDIAFNADGELFTFDADMEWDIGAPWYRPTRVCHVTSGSEFGWRSGSGKWPASFPDSLPPILEHGPGSPTGIAFAYDTRFPESYRRSLFICDWSFGRIDAVQLTPQGASYAATAKEFVTGTPLPVTDIVANPHDGALYFTIGGRRTQSGLYRVIYVGTPAASSATADPDESNSGEFVQQRRMLEAFHGRSQELAVDSILPHLDHPDRFIRFAARTALEWQPVDTWQAQVMTVKDPLRVIEGVLALARCSSPSSKVSGPMIDALLHIDWDQLNVEQRIALLRAFELALVRTDCEDNRVLQRIAATLLPRFPAAEKTISDLLGRLLAYCGATEVIEPLLGLMEKAESQEARMAAAYNLRPLITRMTPGQQQRYFQWFADVDEVRGGASLRGFLRMIRDDAASQLSAADKQRLAPELSATIQLDVAGPIQPAGPIVKEYSIDDVLAITRKPRRAYDEKAARAAFSKALCFHCHRVGDEGGATGPDLTTVFRRFSLGDLADSIVKPDKQVSDRFRRSVFELTNGQVVTGRIANMSRDEIRVLTDMLNPGSFIAIKRPDIAKISPSPQSEMPHGLLNSLTEDEICDLFDFLRAASL